MGNSVLSKERNQHERLCCLAACVCAASAQGLVGGYAGAFNPAPSSQFHAQGEFGQFSFGHAGGPSARTEARNAYGVTTGSYQYIDANGLLQTVNYIADPVNGFRVAGTNLPVAPVVGAVEPLVAPVFDLPLPVAVVDPPEVAAAKAEFATAYAAAAAAAAAAPEEPAAEEAVAEERKRRAADEVAEVAAPAALPAVLPYPYAGAYGVGAGLFGGVYAAAPGAIVANIAHAAPTVAAPLAYAGLGAPLAYAGAAPLAYAGAAPLAYAAPLAAAAPSREAVLTTIKLNPGHAISYRVD